MPPVGFAANLLVPEALLRMGQMAVDKRMGAEQRVRKLEVAKSTTCRCTFRRVTRKSACCIG